MFASKSVRPVKGNATLTVWLGLHPRRIDLTKVSASGVVLRRNSELFLREEDWPKPEDNRPVAVTLH